MEKFKVTPWEVSGKVDYIKLIKEFGTEPLTDSLVARLEKLAGSQHFMLSRKIFFSHRDLPWLLNEYEKGNKFYLYTGRGPSGHTHIGHMLPWILTRWLQQRFNVKVYFQLTDDEKFVHKQDLSLEETNRLAYENALDFIALGFSPKDTTIIVNTDNAKTLYKEALKVAKKVTFSTTKATFGFTDSTNIGLIFYTSMQAVPAFLESIKQGKNIPCLIPHGIDQDPHFRIARDVLPKLGYYKPAALHNIFLPGLSGNSKMSSSMDSETVFVSDNPELVKQKILKHAFSGGQATVKEHRKLGGNPDVDISYQWLYCFFEDDDAKIKRVYDSYASGSLLTSELKELLAEKIINFLRHHNNSRERARKNIHKYMLKE